MSFTLPDLPYAYEALQPYMSKETLEYHHDKHHAAYSSFPSSPSSLPISALWALEVFFQHLFECGGIQHGFGQ